MQRPFRRDFYICWKIENAGHQHFSLFSAMFSTVPKTNQITAILKIHRRFSNTCNSNMIISEEFSVKYFSAIRRKNMENGRKCSKIRRNIIGSLIFSLNYLLFNENDDKKDHQFHNLSKNFRIPFIWKRNHQIFCFQQEKYALKYCLSTGQTLYFDFQHKDL